jgi:hypothetical protein
VAKRALSADIEARGKRKTVAEGLVMEMRNLVAV